MPNIKSVSLKRKELLTYHCGCHGNLVTIAVRYVADAYCPKEAPHRIRSQHDQELESYKLDVAISADVAILVHVATSNLTQI